MLIYSGKALTAAIVDFRATNEERRAKLHTIACSAVRLAARAGRANWLNDLYASLDRLDAQALTSWFATKGIANPVFGVKDQLPWIEFTNQDGFTVIPGTEKLRPSDKEIIAVEANVARSFVHKSVQRVMADTGWNKKLVGQAKTFHKSLVEADKKHPGSVPHHLIVEMETVQHTLAVALDDHKLGIVQAPPPGTMSDDEIEALAEREQQDIPAPHVIDGEVAATKVSRRAKAVN